MISVPKPTPMTRRLGESREAFDPQELLTPDEVCALLKMKRTWFYAEVARGVRRRDLEAYLCHLEQAG